MAIPSIHLAAEQAHFGWNRDLSPALVVRPGDELSVETQDASGGQLRPGSSATSVAELDFSRVNPVNGPVFVD